MKAGDNSTDMAREGVPHHLRVITVEKKGSQSGITPSHLTVGGRHLLQCAISSHYRRVKSAKARVDCSLPAGHLLSVRVQKRLMKELDEEDRRSSQATKIRQPTPIKQQDIVVVDGQRHRQQQRTAAELLSPSQNVARSSYSRTSNYSITPHQRASSRHDSSRTSQRGEAQHARSWRSTGGSSHCSDLTGRICIARQVEAPAPYRKDTGLKVPVDKTVSGRVKAHQERYQTPSPQSHTPARGRQNKSRPETDNLKRSHSVRPKQTKEYSSGDDDDSASGSDQSVTLHRKGVRYADSSTTATQAAAPESGDDISYDMRSGSVSDQSEAELNTDNAEHASSGISDNESASSLEVCGIAEPSKPAASVAEKPKQSDERGHSATEHEPTKATQVKSRKAKLDEATSDGTRRSSQGSNTSTEGNNAKNVRPRRLAKSSQQTTASDPNVLIKATSVEKHHMHSDVIRQHQSHHDVIGQHHSHHDVTRKHHQHPDVTGQHPSHHDVGASAAPLPTTRPLTERKGRHGTVTMTPRHMESVPVMTNQVSKRKQQGYQTVAVQPLLAQTMTLPSVAMRMEHGLGAGKSDDTFQQQSHTLLFIGDITCEIVQRGTTTPKVIQQICKRHMERNTHNLPQTVMEKEVDNLLQSLTL